MSAVTLDRLRVALDARGLLSSYAWHRTQFMARCPCHDDRIASLSIGESEHGQVLVHCHAGCTPDGWQPVLRALDLWEEHPQQYHPQQIQQYVGVNGASASPRPTAVGNTAVGLTAVGKGRAQGELRARDLAAARGRSNVSRLEAQRWQELLELMQGLIDPVPVVVGVPRHARPPVRRLAASIELLLGLRATGHKGYAVVEPFLFTRSNPGRRGEPGFQVGFGEAWSLLSAEQIKGGLYVLRRFGSIEKVKPPPDTDPTLLDVERRGPQSPPTFWRLAAGGEVER